MRRTALAVAMGLTAVWMAGETVTLPAAASIVGQAPFFSDVRVFNTSYTASLNVTATYHCFIPSPCTAGTSPLTMTLAPRESRGFDDIVQTSFAAPNTAGGIEFDSSGSSGQLVVTSRLYSTEPEPTVGMFIPGVDDSAAGQNTVLTSVRNAGAGDGFRTNVGIYNREDTTANVTFKIFDGGTTPVGNPVTASVPGHSGVQINRIFDAAGAVGHASDNAVIVVNSSVQVISYAAVIDNHTTDPIFVLGAEDQPPSSTPTTTTATVMVGQGGGYTFVDAVSGTNTTTINVGGTVTWTWSGTMAHGIQSGTCMGGGGGGGGGYITEQYGGCTPSNDFTSGSHPPPYSFSQTFTTAGTYPYYCIVHENLMKGKIVVNPSGAARASTKKHRRPTA